MVTKLYTYSISALVLIASVLVITSCKQEEYAGPDVYPNSVTGVIANDANFSLFNAALDKAEIVRPLNDAGPFTIFAPTNAALQAAGISTTTIDTIDTASDKNFLMSLITYHMLGGTNLQSVPSNDSAKTNFATLRGTQFFVTQSPSGVIVVNGVRVTDTKQALNGVTYAIGDFLVAPTKNIVQTLNADARFTILSQAIAKAGLTSELGKTTVGYGVFAPTDAAFVAAGYTSDIIAAINPEDPNDTDDLAGLVNLLKYHLTPRVYFSDNITSGGVRTLLGRTRKVTIDAGTGVTVTDELGGTAGITEADILTTNGVIHVIDKVLMPTP